MDLLKKATIQRLLVSGLSLVGTAIVGALFSVLLTDEFKAVVGAYITDPKIAGLIVLLVYNFVAEIKNRYSLKGRLGRAVHEEVILL